MESFFTLIIFVGAIVAYYAWKEFSRGTTSENTCGESGKQKRQRGGFLGLYGLWDWYDSQPKEVQDFLYKSCGYGINTDSKYLTEGCFETLINPDDEYPWTATKFLCQHAMNAAHDKEYKICEILLNSAFMHVKNMKDSVYQGLIAQKIGNIPAMISEQQEVERYKPILFQLVKDNPGILQSEIKKRFPPELENVVGLAHWHNYQDGKVRREKKGRSFQLWVA